MECAGEFKLKRVRVCLFAIKEKNGRMQLSVERQAVAAAMNAEAERVQRRRAQNEREREILIKTINHWAFMLTRVRMVVSNCAPAWPV